METFCDDVEGCAGLGLMSLAIHVKSRNVGDCKRKITQAMKKPYHLVVKEKIPNYLIYDVSLWVECSIKNA